MIDRDELCREALKARLNAYCPYSHFATGAALLGRSGRIYTGCNVENQAYGPTNCAERTAFFKAISEGEREFDAIAICGAVEGEAPSDTCPPCGVCRQVMSEFCEKDFEVILYASEGRTKVYTLDQILPLQFDLESYR